MSREIMQPEITPSNMGGDTYKHPAYAQLSFSRVHGTTELYGSSIQHDNTIVMRLSHSEMNRELNKDWYHDTALIAEVEMSQSQFAEAITSLNIGGGVPCTLRFSEKDGRIPACSFENKRTQFKGEFDERIDSAMQDTQSLISELKTLFSEKKTLTKADKEDVLGTLSKISQNIGCNAKYVASQFEEQMDNSIKEAKGEIEAFAQNRINSIVNNAIAAQGGLGVSDTPVSLLEDKKEE